MLCSSPRSLEERRCGVSRRPPFFFNLSRCLARSSLRIDGPQPSAGSGSFARCRARSWARAASRHSIRVSPSNGLLRKQVAPAFRARSRSLSTEKAVTKMKGKVVALGKQVGLQIEPAHVRHSDIGYHARCVVEVGRSQEIFGRGERMDDVAKRPDEIAGGGANRAIIVDDRYDWWVGQRGSSWRRPEAVLCRSRRVTGECAANPGRRIILRFAARRIQA